MAWKKYLPSLGVEIDVVTATWLPDAPEEKGVYRVNCNADHLYSAKTQSLFFLLKRKFRSFVEIWFAVFWIRYSRFYPLFMKAKSLVKAKEYDYIIATGNPFIFFRFAAVISAQNNLKFILDYRDNWSNQPNVQQSFFLYYFKKAYFFRTEKEILKRANEVITVGEYTAKKISELNSKKNIHIIPNGHDIPIDFHLRDASTNSLVITYIGRLYKHKDPFPFLEGLASYLDLHPHRKIVFHFLGLKAFPNQERYILDRFRPRKLILKFSHPLPYEEMLITASSSHAFLLLADPKIPITTGKLYDYLGLKRPIILFPDDKAIFNEIIKKEECGYIVNNAQEIFSLLDLFFEKISDSSFFQTNVNIEEYSRQKSALQLAKLLYK